MEVIQCRAVRQGKQKKSLPGGSEMKFRGASVDITAFRIYFILPPDFTLFSLKGESFTSKKVILFSLI